MRRVAFVSDIHSNLEALDAVLAQVGGAETFCLGDVVGYGASPNEVVEKVRRVAAVVLLGNHDSAAVTGDTSMFNARAAMAARWTSNQLTSENKAYLRALPREFRAEFEGVSAYFAHGSPDDNLWEYVDPSSHTDLFDHYLDKLDVELIGLGHTHVPYAWTGQRGTVFNPGSVGQPRDGDRRASYAMVTVEGEEVKVETLRVEYDCRKAAERILKVGLPASLGQRLSLGM